MARVYSAHESEIYRAICTGLIASIRKSIDAGESILTPCEMLVDCYKLGLDAFLEKYLRNIKQEVIL